MRTIADLNEQRAELSADNEILDLYIKAISWNLRSMVAQADVLETEIAEIRRWEREIAEDALKTIGSSALYSRFQRT